MFHKKGTFEGDTHVPGHARPAVNILKVTHRGSARSDAACLLPLLEPLVKLIYDYLAVGEDDSDRLQTLYPPRCWCITATVPRQFR